MAADLTVNYADASEVCRAPWRTEAAAREQAAILDAAGWRVEHRFPPAEFGTGSGLMVVASVYDPVSFWSPGTITYQAVGNEPGS